MHNQTSHLKKRQTNSWGPKYILQTCELKNRWILWFTIITTNIIWLVLIVSRATTIKATHGPKCGGTLAMHGKLWWKVYINCHPDLLLNSLMPMALISSMRDSRMTWHMSSFTAKELDVGVIFGIARTTHGFHGRVLRRSFTWDADHTDWNTLTAKIMSKCSHILGKDHPLANGYASTTSRPRT